ncbi:MAG: hypothetical protein DMD85_18110 [Candidatus Rokuibacteriota bacterium]|nr:MAG: hypothetical protein DMD85_18110 [Candidatus Rokubacteria bacterium]
MLRAAAIAERAGVPSVSIVTTPFMQQAAVVSKGVGLPSLPIAEYPGVPMTDGPEAVARKVEALLPQIIAGLAGARDVARAAVAEPPPREIVYRGSLEEIQEHFHEHLWSDGLPVIPPTLAHVERFLAHTRRAPDDVIGRLLPENRAATIWSIAVNGVMAGCRPEYMPVLVAIVEAIAEPIFRVEDAGSTPGWEPLVIVSGPIAKRLDLNHGQGVMRVGRQANTTLGRFLRLYGWPTFGADQGFTREDSVVTVQSVVSISPPIYSAGTRALEHARILAEVFGGACGYWSSIGMKYARWEPLLVLGPSIARVIAEDGWSKDDLRRYLHEHVTITARQAETYALQVGATSYTLEAHVKAGVLPAAYALSTDPERTVPVFVQPEKIGILVAGDPGRNQSKGYVNNHIQGGRVSKRI